MEKVFCSKCKFIKKSNFGFSCSHPDNTKLTYFEDTWYIKGNENNPIIEYIQAPQILNKDNNCKNFKFKDMIRDTEPVKKRWWHI